MATNGVERRVERPKRADSIIDEHSQSPDKEHDVAVTSPYTTRAVTVYFGKSRSVFTVQQAIVDQYPGLKERLNSDDSIILDTVDENIGHTLIHFIYTNRYQTLKSDGPDEHPAFTDFERALLAYCAARLCGIAKLEDYIKDKAEGLQKELSVFDLQVIAKEISSKLSQRDDWFATSIQKWVKARLIEDATLLTDERLPDVIGRSKLFDRAVVRSMMEMCVEKGVNGGSPVVNGDHSSTDSEPAVEFSKAESAADSAIHMSPRQESLTDPIIDAGPQDISDATANPENSFVMDKTPKLEAQVVPEKPADAPDVGLLETTEKAEDSLQRENFRVPTDSDGEPAIVKPAKKGKKNKKKSH